MHWDVLAGTSVVVTLSYGIDEQNAKCKTAKLITYQVQNLKKIYTKTAAKNERSVH